MHVSLNGYASISKQLIDARCHVELLAKDESTPIYIAALKGHASVTKQLIEARCNIDLQDNDGFTPLHVAAHNGYAAVAQLLLAARCNIDLQTKDGETALQAAQRAGIATLIRNTQHKGPVNARNDTTLQASPDARKRQEVKVQRAPVRRRQ